MSTPNDTTYCVYRIVCFPTGKYYIGKTNDPVRRKRQHFNYLKAGLHHNSHLQRAYSKYGEDAFYFEVVEDGIDAAQINSREIFWIDSNKEHHLLFNLTNGGVGGGKRKQVVWNGSEYESLKAAAKAAGVKEATMSARVSKGYKCDTDMPGRGVNIPHSKTCVWNSVEYKSLAAAARANGKSKDTMAHLLSRGYTCDDDIGHGGGYGAKPVVWNRIEYESLAVAARTIGISASALKERLDKGYTCDSDIKRPMKWSNGVKGSPCAWNDVHYESISAAARALGINVATMRERLQKGYTCDADLKVRHK